MFKRSKKIQPKKNEETSYIIPNEATNHSSYMTPHKNLDFKDKKYIELNHRKLPETPASSNYFLIRSIKLHLRKLYFV